MNLWKLTLAYDGTPFHGWQVQPGLPTVQGTLSDALYEMTGERVLPQGSGRTDAGVHALGQVASFALVAPIPAANLLRALNRILPPSIRILLAEPATEGFHARHGAIRKTYEYRVFPLRPETIPFSSAKAIPDRICSPMLAPYTWACRWPLDLGALQEAGARVEGTHDFRSFAASDPDLTTRSETEAEVPSTVRTIDRSVWQKEGELLIYRVTGTGFLHHMVRNLVGTFAEIGAHRMDAAAVPGILAARDRSAAGPTAPASGLFLVSVEYPPEPDAAQPPLEESPA